MKSKLSTAKKSKTTTFSWLFHPKKIDNFLGKSSWIFGQKMNTYFEKCESVKLESLWVCVLLPPFFFLFLVFLFSLSPLSSSPFHEIPCTSFKTGHVTCAKSGQFVSFCTQLSTEAVHAGIRTPFVTCTTTTLLVRDGWSAFSKDQILSWQKTA